MLLDSDLAGRPMCVALVDVDNFKQVNDCYSHSVGDQVLASIAEILKRHVREHDVAARLAGDEFVLAFRSMDFETTAKVCVRITEAVTEHDWAAIAEGLRVSVSVGVAQSRSGDTLDSLVHRSDEAMYRRKGRHGSESSAPLVR